MRLYHVTQVEGDEPYIDTEITNVWDVEDAYGERGLVTEEELQGRPEFRKALEDWRKGDDRVRVRSQCKIVLHDIWNRLEDVEVEVEDRHHLLIEEGAKRLQDESPCRALVDAMRVMRELAEVLKPAPRAMPTKESPAERIREITEQNV